MRLAPTVRHASIASRSAIGRGLDVPTKSIPAEVISDILGSFLGMIAQMDNPTSSARTRELLADIAAGHCFA